MKALGIPNNKDFYEVTKIDDALSLWKNIQVSSSAGLEYGFVNQHMEGVVLQPTSLLSYPDRYTGMYTELEDAEFTMKSCFLLYLTMFDQSMLLVTKFDQS
jgi:hypothetical protein